MVNPINHVSAARLCVLAAVYIVICAHAAGFDEPLGSPDTKTSSDDEDSSRPQRILGWISGVSAADGVISGWAGDRAKPNVALTVSFYSDAPPTEGGVFMGRVIADAINYAPAYMHGLSASHGFVFSIPENFKNGSTRRFFAQAADPSESKSVLLSGSIATYNLRPIAETTTVTDAAKCSSPKSVCKSAAFDYGRPNFPVPIGWSDGKDVFKAWDCDSSAGFNRIARLNIIPFGGSDGVKYHDRNFQKDSLLVNIADQEFGSPLIYFTSSRYAAYSSTYSLKKAAFGPKGDWEIFDILDYPSNTSGLSSLDGRYPAFVMNDYSLPGWGPTSPFSGSGNLVPGVSNTASNPEKNSFRLVGTGPYGLTTIVELLQGAGLVDAGVAGRTCLHMNPKLFDFDPKGIPRSMLAYMFYQFATGKRTPCLLPNGSILPRADYYVYRFHDVNGWQLDNNFGPVESSDNADEALKLVANANSHIFIAGNWDGQITTIDLDSPPPRRKAVILSCKKLINGSSAKFGEATGSTDKIWFLGIPPGIPPAYKGGAFKADIYFAYIASLATSRSGKASSISF
jgi:hypothetical protein